jgi:hypothetical protein
MTPHFLPAGPWESRGNKVVTGTGQTIATVFYPRYAAQIAEMLTKLPELIKRVEELEAQLGFEEEEK